MEKLIFSLNAILLSSMLLITLPTHGMDHEELLLQAETYNQNHSLPSLPQDILNLIFSYLINHYRSDLLYGCGKDRELAPVDALESIIDTFVMLSSTCKKFNTLLTIETISKLCKNCDLNHKNMAIKSLLKKYTIYDESSSSYATSIRLPILILICAGASPETVNSYTEESVSLLQHAVWKNDVQLAKILFKQHNSPNERYLRRYRGDENKVYSEPIFFNAQTEMAQVFINKNVDLYAVNSKYGTNVLWAITNNGYHPLSLITLYLDYKVDATQRDWNNSCLLHHIASPGYTITNVHNFLEKCNLLLNVIPHMVNALNNNKNTPLDTAKNSLWLAKNIFTETEFFLKKLIVLFEEHGGRLSKDLRKQKKTKSILSEF